MQQVESSPCPMGHFYAPLTPVQLAAIGSSFRETFGSRSAPGRGAPRESDGLLRKFQGRF